MGDGDGVVGVAAVVDDAVFFSELVDDVAGPVEVGDGLGMVGDEFAESWGVVVGGVDADAGFSEGVVCDLSEVGFDVDPGCGGDGVAGFAWSWGGAHDAGFGPGWV